MFAESYSSSCMYWQTSFPDSRDTGGVLPGSVTTRSDTNAISVSNRLWPIDSCQEVNIGKHINPNAHLGITKADRK